MLKPNSYYDAHCLPLGEASRLSLEVYRETATLVLLSIQQPWHRMPIQFADVRENGRQSVYLFGWKRKGFDFILAHGERLQEKAYIAYESRDLESLILAYLEVPGFGLAKASFFAQLTIGQGACLDVHNLKRLGLDANAMALVKTLKIETIAQRVRLYNAAWQTVGDSRYWWDTWCDHLSKKNKRHFNNDGWAVSELHTLPLK